MKVTKHYIIGFVDGDVVFMFNQNDVTREHLNTVRIAVDPHTARDIGQAFLEAAAVALTPDSDK